ncbi:hypothetical protein NUU61_008575 [Penicillium alfredii]|uniref:Uncharacterized protein n=1 Tax=Penicillium alfredii TaxID=1506179 RepID=A0A9W9ELN9_9EURO|nr:uncharacterized protein NUU61_008575 [Penicillium alfredii]KAJ5083996.1 hypothetical protein NUU61_008575 [Penicillium alfredii]
MDALNEWSTTLLENPPVPENNPYTNTWYSNSDKSLPHILNDGDFADTPGSTISDDVSKTMRKHFRPGALAYIWSRENAFIVKISRKVEGKPPCDFDLSNWGIDEVYCDGGTAYFFTTPFDTSNLSKRTMDAPAGYKSLSDYDMTPDILIRSSIVAQASSGYFKQWTLEESLDFFSTETDMPIEMFNAPICDLDKVKNWDNNKGMGYSYKNTELRQNIKFCVDQKDQNGVKWPYQWNKFLW